MSIRAADISGFAPFAASLRRKADGYPDGRIVTISFEKLTGSERRELLRSAQAIDLKPGHEFLAVAVRNEGEDPVVFQPHRGLATAPGHIEPDRLFRNRPTLRLPQAPVSPEPEVIMPAPQSNGHAQPQAQAAPVAHTPARANLVTVIQVPHDPQRHAELASASVPALALDRMTEAYKALLHRYGDVVGYAEVDNDPDTIRFLRVAAREIRAAEVALDEVTSP